MLQSSELFRKIIHVSTAGLLALRVISLAEAEQVPPNGRPDTRTMTSLWAVKEPGVRDVTVTLYNWFSSRRSLRNVMRRISKATPEPKEIIARKLIHCTCTWTSTYMYNIRQSTCLSKWTHLLASFPPLVPDPLQTLPQLRYYIQRLTTGEIFLRRLSCSDRGSRNRRLVPC